MRARILIIDGSVLARRQLAEQLGRAPWLEVLRPAASLRLGLARIAEDRPDVVLLDASLLASEGGASLEAVRDCGKDLPVVLWGAERPSGFAESGARRTVWLDRRPSAGGGVEGSPDLLASLRKAAGLGGDAAVGTGSGVVPSRVVTERRQAAVEVVVIGVSTGGPNALVEMLPRLPGDLAVPVLIVQHMPPMFTRLLAERLDARCQLRVREAAAGDRPQPGQVFVAPGNHHLTVDGDIEGMVLALNQDPPENSCRPAVDVLFRSAAARYGPGCLGVVLTGMGQDGLRGAEAIVKAGGRVLAQDEASSVVWGMPGFVARSGLAAEVLPLDQIAAAIEKRVGRQNHGSRVARGNGVKT